MRKKIVCILFFVLLISATLPGCSLSKPETVLAPNKETGAAEDKVKIKLSYHTEGADNKIDELIAAYNRSNSSNLWVETVKIPEDRYDETLNMMYTSGESPDVFEIGKQWLFTYISKSWVTDLRHELDPDFRSRFPDWVWKEAAELASGGSIYALPVNQSTVRLIYNKEMFSSAGLDPEAPPKTLTEMAEYARKIGKAGIGLKQYGLALPAGDERMCFEQLMEAANTYSGAYYFDFPGNRYDLSVYKEWFQTILEMKNDGTLFPGENSLKNYTALEQFSEGHVGMMYATGEVAALLKTQLPVSFPWGVAMPPVIADAAKGLLKITPSSYFAVSTGSSHKKEAINLWKYLYSEEFTGQLYQNGTIIPVTKGIMDNPAYAPDIEHLKDFLPGREEVVYPLVPLMVNDWDRFGIYSRILELGSYSEQAIEEINERLNGEFDYKYQNGFPKKTIRP